MLCHRKTLRDVTLSNGTVIPKGTWVAVAATETHYDEQRYHEPERFIPFRFYEMAGEESKKTDYLCTTTSVDYVAFGHGRHAW